MGGRGASSGMKGAGEPGTGFSIRGTDGKIREYDVLADGIIESRSTPGRISADAKKIIANAKKQGKLVKVYSKAEIKARREKRRKEKAGIDYEMGIGTPWGNKGNRRAARADRMDRAAWRMSRRNG